MIPAGLAHVCKFPTTAQFLADCCNHILHGMRPQRQYLSAIDAEISYDSEDIASMFAASIELGDEDATYRYINRAGIHISPFVEQRQRVLQEAEAGLPAGGNVWAMRLQRQARAHLNYIMRKKCASPLADLA